MYQLVYILTKSARIVLFNNDEYFISTCTEVIDESLPKKPPKSSGVTTKCLPFILKKSPEKSDVYDLLKKKSAYWEEFALELKLGDSFRQELRREGAVTTSRIKLDKVLMKWIDSETSDVTWSNIINMLEELEFLDLARNVDDYLSKEDVVKKYIQKEDYEGKSSQTQSK